MDVFGSHNDKRYWCLVSRGQDYCLTSYNIEDRSPSPQIMRYLGQNVNSAEVEKSWPTFISILQLKKLRLNEIKCIFLRQKASGLMELRYKS